MLDSLVDIILAPQSRLYWAYWLSGLLVALVWALLAWKKRNAFLFNLRRGDYWFNRSSSQDLAIIVLNQGLFLLLGVSWLLLTLSISTSTLELLRSMTWLESLRSHDPTLAQSFSIIILYSLALLLLDDATRYGLHRWMHHSPILWRVHRVHHSAHRLTLFTFLRVHPAEKLLYHLRSVTVHGGMVGIGFFLLGQSPEAYLLFGVNAWVIAFHTVGAILRHSEIPVSFGWFERFFISPVQHQIHHCLDGQRANYGSMLSIWDRFFHSYRSGETFTEYRLPILNESMTQQLLLKTPLKLK